jgi:integrase
MPVRLNEPAIAAAAREVTENKVRKELVDAGCPGLRLRLTPAGGKSWVLACRDRSGRMRRFPLGAFPAMGVSEARDEARALHAKVKHDGADPVADRRRERAQGAAARLGEGTLQAMLDVYGTKVASEQKSWEASRKRVDLVFKPLLQKPVASLKASDFQAEADSYSFPKSASFAVRTVRPALKWAEERGHAGRGVSVLRSPAVLKRRRRVLSGDELRRVLLALKAFQSPYAAALMFMLLTLARRQEVAAATWGTVDLKAMTWTIPETKNGEAHVVPLSTQAVALLQARQPKKPLKDALVFASRTGGMLTNWDRMTKVVQAASKTSGWTRHDLRRTGATMLGDMGELPDIIEAALNHVTIHSPLAATYNRSRYRAQVTAALQKLGDAISCSCA